MKKEMYNNYKKNAEKTELDYGFYSNVLKKPFERLADLKKAEEVYYAEQKVKEDAAFQKKADAKKVEDAFKALNAARKAYKEDLTQLTKEYAESLENLKKAYELGKKDIHSKLADAESAYSAALKEFTDKYESYHLSLKDGDFETTISNQVKEIKPKKSVDYADVSKLFDLLFNF
jgi:uncharacterized protein YihD (DUF1040 family)